MAETVANRKHGVIILADINAPFLYIVVEIRNIFFSLGSLGWTFAFCTKAGTGRKHCADTVILRQVF